MGTTVNPNIEHLVRLVGKDYALDIEKGEFLRDVLRKAYESEDQGGSVLVSEFHAQDYGYELIAALERAEMCWVEGDGSNAKVMIPLLLPAKEPDWL